MTDSLNSLLAALAASRLPLDAEEVLDTLWLSLRFSERTAARQSPEVRWPWVPGASQKRGESTQADEPSELALGLAEPDLAKRGSGQWLRMPAAPALPDARSLARALRPLRRRSPSPDASAIDEAETARRVAEEDLWLPVRRWVPERRFKLFLVVEWSLSMAVWRDTIGELFRAFRSSGSLRDLRFWWMDTSDHNARLYARPRDLIIRRQPRRLREVCCGPGQNLVLLLTDCVSTGWYDGRITAALQDSARHVPLALLQVLPEPMWGRTALAEGIPVRFQTTTEAATNTHLRWAEILSFDEPTRDVLPLPVSSLNPSSFGLVIRLLAGIGSKPVPGFLFDVEDQRAGGTPPPSPPSLSAHERVLRFWSTASPLAAKLAALYAASPFLDLGFLRLLQRELLPGAGKVQEAEVLLSGLLRVRFEGGADQFVAERIELEFVEGVRPLLLENAPVSEVLQMFTQAAELAERRGIAMPSVKVWLADPTAAEGKVDPEANDFTRVFASVLERVGGPYARLVRRLRHVQFNDVLINGEVYKARVETVHSTPKHGEIRACTVVHEQLFARRLGGVRFVQGSAPEDRTEVSELAQAMTWKSPLAAIPADGEKTVVYCPAGYPEPAKMAEILAAHLAELKVADPGVIFGPDINCGEAVMDLLAHVYGEGDHVSGLIEGKGGLSIDGYGYTARGLEAALLVTAKRLGWNLSKMRAAIQGFGAVGAHLARNLGQHGVTIQAVSSYHGVLVATTSAGLDIDFLFKRWQEHGDDFFKHYAEETPAGARWAERDGIFGEEAEIFIPAARTDVLAMPGELQSLYGAADVTRFAKTTGVKVVLEGANHPLTVQAENYLEEHGVFVLPDYLVNSGGLIGCWTDWVYRRELEGPDGDKWYDRLNEEVRLYTAKVVERNISRILDSMDNRAQGMRSAAFGLAKELRDGLKSEFESFRASNPIDVDGRAFARFCMDKQLA